MTFTRSASKGARARSPGTRDTFVEVLHAGRRLPRPTTHRHRSAAPCESPPRRSPASARRPARLCGARAAAAARSQSTAVPVPPRRTGSAASSSHVVSAGHAARTLRAGRSSVTDLKTGTRRTRSRLSVSSPCSCTAFMPVTSSTSRSFRRRLVDEHADRHHRRWQRRDDARAAVRGDGRGTVRPEDEPERRRALLHRVQRIHEPRDAADLQQWSRHWLVGPRECSLVNGV